MEKFYLEEPSQERKKDILDYFYEYDVKYSDKILEYIIKSPTNWNHVTILNKKHDSLKSFNSFIEYGICYDNK